MTALLSSAFLFLAQTPSSLDSPLGYGVIAGALVFGAGLQYRYGTLPERARAERAEARADKESAEKTDAYRATLPALASAEALADRVLAVIPEVPVGRRRSRQESEQ